MEEPKNLSDHDKITTLVATVQFIKDGQESFYKEMKESFKDLKDNYANRLDDLDIRVEKLEDKQIPPFALAFVIGLGLLILGLVIYHLTGYHI